MALEGPGRNKMMTAAPAKKEFHFPGNEEYFAATIYAADYREAVDIYLKTQKRDAQAPQQAEEQSTEVPGSTSEKDV